MRHGAVYIMLKSSGYFLNISNKHIFNHMNPHVGLTESAVTSDQQT